MACPKIALTMLILGNIMVLGTDARAQADGPGSARLAQAPASPAPPAAPAPPPAAGQPAAPAAQQTPDPVGSVATLQGAASVTRNNATSALALRDPVYKNDVLQTNVDGTLGITFDDETTFTLKPNTRLAVDEFVYQEGGSGNAAVFNVVRGTAAFVAAEVARTGNMKIDTPTSSLGIRGTTGLVEVPEGGTAGGQVSIKLYPDADGRVGRIEVFGRDGAQLGILSRGATGFAIRPGAGGRFSAAPLQISREQAERDRTFVRQTFAARTVGRQINQQRPTFQQQRNPLRPNQLNPQRPGQLPGREQRPGLQQQRPELRTTVTVTRTTAAITTTTRRAADAAATWRTRGATTTAARRTAYSAAARSGAARWTTECADFAAATRRPTDAATAAWCTADPATATRRGPARRPSECADVAAATRRSADLAAAARSAAGSTTRAGRAAQAGEEE
jgi:hypothetical protein